MHLTVISRSMFVAPVPLRDPVPESSTAPDHWIRIKSVGLDFGSANRDLSYPVGSDLVSWEIAAEQRYAVRTYNTVMALGAVEMIGLGVAAANGGNSGLATAGVAGAAVAMGSVTALALQDSKRAITIGPVVPPSHLFAGEFAIPPGLHARKWLVVQKGKAPLPVSDIVLSYVLADGRTERSHLDLRPESQQLQYPK